MKYALSLLPLLFLVSLFLVQGVYAQNDDTCTTTTPCPLDTYGNPQCCSQYFYCGNKTSHCGAGCISGPCNASLPTPTPDPNPTLDPMDCSNNRSCPSSNFCCSEFFFCGTSPKHCGPGCRAGPCNSSITAPPLGSCAITKCELPTHCCSKHHYCGDTEDYCGVGCVSGPCLNIEPPIAYNPTLVAILGVIIGVCFAIAIVSSLILAFRRSYFNRHGPFYSGVIISGVILSFLAAFVLLPKQTDGLCIAFPWMLGVAFNLVYGCLFIKTWVLYGIFRKAAQMKKVFIEPFYILKLLGVFLAIEIVFLVIWSLFDPPKAKFFDIEGSDLYYIRCRSRSMVFWIIFLAYKGCWVLFGAVLCFVMRKMPKEYSKAKTIAYAIYNNIVIILLSGLLVGVLPDVENAQMVIKVIAIVLSFTFTLVVLNFSVWYKIFFAKFDVVGHMMKGRPNSSTSSYIGSQDSQQDRSEKSRANTGSSSSTPPAESSRYSSTPFA